MLKNDVSYLFNSLNTSSNSLSSINLSDYAAIKNGSYGKLVKSYYASQKSDSDTTSTAKNNKKNSDSVDKTGLSKLKTEADGLKSALSDLGDSEIWKTSSSTYDRAKIEDGVKKFVSEYNDVISQASKVTSSSQDISQNLNFMTSMTNTMKNALSKVGVTVSTDGKLSVEEDTLASADIKNLKSLFSGSTSYGGQVEKYAGNVSSTAARENSTYTSTGSLNTTLASTYSEWI